MAPVGVGIDLISLEAGCPTAPTGKTYVGLYDDTAGDVLTAILYADGAGQSIIAQKSYAGLFGSVSAGHVRRDHDFGGGDRLVFLASGAGGPRSRIVTWDLDGNTFAVLDWGSTLDFLIVIDGYMYAGEPAAWAGAGGNYSGEAMMEAPVGTTSPGAFPVILRVGYPDSGPGGVFSAMGAIMGDWSAAFQEIIEGSSGERRLGLYNGTDGDPEWGPVLASISGAAYAYLPIFGEAMAATWGAIAASSLYAMVACNPAGEEKIITPSPWHSVITGHGPVEASTDGSHLTSLVTHAGQLSILRLAAPAWADTPVSSVEGCPPPTLAVSPYLGMTPSAMLPRD